MASSEVAFNSEIEALLIFGGGTSSVILAVVMLLVDVAVSTKLLGAKIEKVRATCKP